MAQIGRSGVAVAALWLVGGLLTSCGDDEVAERAPDFSSVGVLAAFEPSYPDTPTVLVETPTYRVEVVLRGGRPMLETTYWTGAWQPTELDGCWFSELHVPTMLVDDGYLRDSAGYPDGQQLAIDGEVFEMIATPLATHALENRRPGTWGTAGQLFAVQLPEGAALPQSAVLRVPLPVGTPRDGSWHVESTRWSGTGFTCIPGAAQTVDLPTGHARTLHFSWFAAVPEVASTAPAPRLELRSNSALLWSSEVDPATTSPHGELRYARVELPDDVDHASFTTAGGVAFLGVLEPRIVTGSEGLPQGATHDGRPNLVLFSADTLRADAFEMHRRYSGSPTRTFKSLEALAARSLAFENSWSASSWTLPSHTALLAGVHPDTSAVATAKPLSRGLVTVAEHLRAAGYRTVAITDAGLMSIDAAFDQGFDVFDQAGRGMIDRLARAHAALGSHDGRPTFLFVHTFAVHAPYLPSDEARRADELTEAQDWARIQLDVEALTGRPEEQQTTHGRELIDTARALYWSEVFDLDHDVGTLLAAYDSGGWKANSAFVFTSDHGEAFGEQGQVFHLNRLYESQNRVPLFVIAPQSKARRRTDVAGGVDVAATLLDLAGLAVPESWPGRSLLVEHDGVAWSSVGAGADRVGTQLTLTDGRTKLFADLGNDERFAHELVGDPDELDRRPFDIDRRLVERFESGRGAVAEPTFPLDGSEGGRGSLLDTLENLGYVDKER